MIWGRGKDTFAIQIKSKFIDKFKNLDDTDVIVIIRDYIAFNSQVSKSGNNYLIRIPIKHARKMKKYIGVPLDITVKFTKEIKK